MIDYHIHPNFSPDASGSIIEYCQQALKVGIKELCFTTHYEPDPLRAGIEYVVVGGKRMPVDSDWVKDYFAEIASCQEHFPELEIKAGIEIGYEMGLEGKIADFLARANFDFVLGAVHCLDHIAITAGKEMDEFRKELMVRGADYIARRYFEYIRGAANSRLFDAIAHLDIWRKYLLKELGEQFAKKVEEMVEMMIGEIARAGVGLEINTAPLRQGSTETYPPKHIIQQAFKMGIRTFTVGSDAHQPQFLGMGIKQAIQILLELGLTPARFKNRQII